MSSMVSVTAGVAVAGGLAVGLALAAPMAFAQTQGQPMTVPVESGVNGGSAVNLYLHPFLTPEEVATLRVVATNNEALSLFVTSRTGHAALAVSPQDGFVRNGTPVPSATALGDLPDAGAARTAALAACDQARTGQMPCVVVLEVAPAR